MTADEMLRSLVGSEMCIRDSSIREFVNLAFAYAGIELEWKGTGTSEQGIAVSYTHLTLPTIYTV